MTSDSHSLSGELPFKNKNFNILVGDISNSHVKNNQIKGIYVIGNHEIIDSLEEIKVLNKTDNRRLYKQTWLKSFDNNFNSDWYKLPTEDNIIYELVAQVLKIHYPKMVILNNDSMIYDGVRYIGSTIPIRMLDRKTQQQKFIANKLVELINNDYNIPTVIISHAPLFNELSIISPTINSYNSNFDCENMNIKKLFERTNIISAIHGHNHIPASKNRAVWANFVGKRIFIVCSIYSQINTGFDLTSLL